MDKQTVDTYPGRILTRFICPRVDHVFMHIFYLSHCGQESHYWPVLYICLKVMPLWLRSPTPVFQEWTTIPCNIPAPYFSPCCSDTHTDYEPYLLDSKVLYMMSVISFFLFFLWVLLLLVKSFCAKRAWVRISDILQAGTCKQQNEYILILFTYLREVIILFSILLYSRLFQVNATFY